jgi:hypothetical protein
LNKPPPINSKPKNEKPKEKTSREKAIEFSKNVPKPKVRNLNEDSASSQQDNPY